MGKVFMTSPPDNPLFRVGTSDEDQGETEYMHHCHRVMCHQQEKSCLPQQVDDSHRNHDEPQKADTRGCPCDTRSPRVSTTTVEKNLRRGMASEPWGRRWTGRSSRNSLG